MRHFGVPSGFTTGRSGETIEAVKAVYQNICWAMLPWLGKAPASAKFIPAAAGGEYLSSHSLALVMA